MLSIATLIAGVLDILLAFANVAVSTGGKPAMVLRYIASGIYGTRAFSGSGYEAIGLALHFFITFICALLYFLAFRQNEMVKRHWIISGILYGIVICLFMNFVVLPLSNTPPAEIKAYPLFKSIVIQVVATGLPISWLLRRY